MSFTTVGKKYGDFAYKMKIIYLFFEINFIPFKVLPVQHNALMPTFFPILESVRKVFFRNGHQHFFDLTLIFSNESKRCPRSGLLSLVNSQKAKSNEYGGCGTIWVEFLTKCSRWTNAVWNDAFWWCKNPELSAHNSGLL